MTRNRDSKLYIVDKDDGELRKRVFSKETDAEILSLMQSYLGGLVYDEIRKEEFDNYRMYDIYNNGFPLDISLKIFYESNQWRVAKASTKYFLVTEEDELLVQENEDELILE